MAIDLLDYVPALQREVNPPGANVFGTVTDETWVGYLGDAFWEARLDGFLDGYEVEGDGADLVLQAETGNVDPPRQMLALVVLYAGIRVLRNQILNTNTTFSAKAGPVEFEQQKSATMLAEMLKQLKQTKDRIILQLDEDTDVTQVVILDAYSTRLFEPLSYFGGMELSG